jgi:hypothetical protein
MVAPALLTRLIAGIPVPNTALINSSIALAQQNMPIQGFNHVMRAWLNGQAIINRMPREQRREVDEEAFGVASILHDMGWAFGTPFVSQDKRFEVDGADAAREHVKRNGGRGWDKHRVQLVWDAVALHTTRDIGAYKEIEVQLTSAGTLTELVGPENARRTWVSIFFRFFPPFLSSLLLYHRYPSLLYVVDTLHRVHLLPSPKLNGTPSRRSSPERE